MLALIRSTRTLATGGFLVSAASFFFVFVIFVFLFCSARHHCQPCEMARRGVGPDRDARKQNGGDAPAGDSRFFAWRRARTSIEGRFHVKFTIKAGNIDP